MTTQQAASAGTDAITLEIVKNALGSIADEMALVVLRTAYSRSCAIRWTFPPRCSTAPAA